MKSDYGPSIKFLININLAVKTILRRQQDEICNLSILATEEYFRRPAGKGTRGRESPLKDTCVSGLVYQNVGRDSAWDRDRRLQDSLCEEECGSIRKFGHRNPRIIGAIFNGTFSG